MISDCVDLVIVRMCFFAAETGDVGHACEVCKVPVRVWKLQWCSRVSLLCAISGELIGIGAEMPPGGSSLLKCCKYRTTWISCINSGYC